jgi:hypothetical protein
MVDHMLHEITLVHCESQHEFNRSMVRYERLKQKYPEFTLVIPNKYKAYRGIQKLIDGLNSLLPAA